MAVASIPSQSAAKSIKYGRLCQTHPRINAMRLRILHAMYRGGVHLLGDGAVMDIIFGKIGDESDSSYGERVRRAFYENLFALVINQISAGLAQDPCRLAFTDSAQPDLYWTELMQNATVVDEDGSEERSFDQVMRDICVEALVCGWSWIQADLPSPSGYAPAPVSYADQESSGDLRAYVCTWPTDRVTDWEEKGGKLLWVRTYECLSFSETPDQPRFPDIGGKRTHRWTIWDADGWRRYEYVETKDAPIGSLNPESAIPAAESGSHSFGRVPWIRFDLCTPGTYLHVGDLVESLCRIYFNRTNGESWQWTQSCFQQLYEFLAPEMAGIDTMVSQAGSDPSRAKRQRRAPGVVHERGHEDRAEYVGPNMGGADVGAKATQDMRDAVLRVTAQLALAQDTSGAMLRRSADSKKQDAVAQEIVLGAVGKRLLVAARQLVRLLAAGRGDEEAPGLDGYERFSVDDANDVINQTVILDAISIPSATFQVESKFRTALAHLGDNLTSQVKSKIRQELEGAITQDQVQMSADPSQDAPPTPPQGDDDDDSQSSGTIRVGSDKDGRVSIADGEQPEPTTQPLADEIQESLADDFPPEAIEWIQDASWEGPTRVDLADIDYTNSANWHAADEPDKVSGQADQIAEGWEKPIILVRKPGQSKLQVEDGHHRALAYLHNGKSALAYVGTVPTADGPWDEMHDQQSNGGKSGSKSDDAEDTDDAEDEKAGVANKSDATAQSMAKKIAPRAPVPKPKLPQGKSDAGPAKKIPAPGHQEKPWSCGPAALVNVCSALGIDVTEKRVRELSDADKDGTDERQLLSAAKSLGLIATVRHTGDASESWRLLVKDVSAGKPSLICTQDWDHWVAIVGVTGDRVVMLDSANTKENVDVNGVHLMTKIELTKVWKCKGVEKSFYAVSFMRKK